MKKIVQQIMLSSYSALRVTAAIMLISFTSQSCSKNDTIADSGKPLQVTRSFQFNVLAGNQFSEEESRSISLKLRLSISGFKPGINSKQLLWDTLISRPNLYEFTHSPGENIAASLTGSATSFQHLLFEYVIIYNDRGSLVTRTETAALAEKERMDLRL